MSSSLRIGGGGAMDGCCCRAQWIMASGVAVVLLKLLAMRRLRRCPVVPVGRVATSVEHSVLRVQPVWNAEGAANGGLALVKHHIASKGCSHACRWSCRRGSTRSRRHSGGSSVRRVRTVHGRSTQGWNSAGNGGTVTGIGGQDSDHTRCAAWLPDAV